MSLGQLPEEINIYRLRLGTVYTDSSVYKIRKTRSATCSCEEAEDNTFFHIEQIMMIDRR